MNLQINLFAIRGAPKLIRCDNGPEFISRRLREFLERIDVGASYVEPGSPWQNGYVESFHSRFRDECFGCEEFTTMAEAVAAIGHWRQGYNSASDYAFVLEAGKSKFCCCEPGIAAPRPLR